MMPYFEVTAITANISWQSILPLSWSELVRIVCAVDDYIRNLYRTWNVIARSCFILCLSEYAPRNIALTYMRNIIKWEYELSSKLASASLRLSKRLSKNRDGGVVASSILPGLHGYESFWRIDIEYAINDGKLPEMWAYSYPVMRITCYDDRTRSVKAAIIGLPKCESRFSASGQWQVSINAENEYDSRCRNISKKLMTAEAFDDIG